MLLHFLYVILQDFIDSFQFVNLIVQLVVLFTKFVILMDDSRFLSDNLLSEFNDLVRWRLALSLLLLLVEFPLLE